MRWVMSASDRDIIVAVLLKGRYVVLVAIVVQAGWTMYRKVRGE